MNNVILVLHVYSAETTLKVNETDERKSPDEAKHAWENSSLGFIDAVYE